MLTVTSRAIHSGENREKMPENHIVNNGLTPIRLLLVEDHDDTRKSMEFLLKRHRYEVKSAASGTEALEMAANGEFDVVLSDLGLPDMHGCELMSQLSTAHGLVGIAATGHSMPEDIEACHKAGFVRHVTKPINLTALRAVISEVVTTK